MKFSSTLASCFLLIFSSIILISGCNSSRDTVATRNMQNLTARYNIRYNANEILKASEESIANAEKDNYGELLSVYKEPTEVSAQAEAKNLDSVLIKANTIISEKSLSRYIGDAFLLKGKANYLKASFFTADEFFRYTYVTFPSEKDLRQEALLWRARSLMQINNLPQAAIALDSTLKKINDNPGIAADVYATEAQFNIISGNEEYAITMLEKALKEPTSKSNKLRWTYLLGQLQEQNNLPQEAYKNYTTIVKSNAPFEMAFHANLKRIRIEEEQSAQPGNKVARLRSLLKDDKNADFIDQIYTYIGDVYLDRGEKENAIREYNLALRSSTTNSNQKGLTYLKIADIHFKNADYVSSKAYYDSTLANLSPQYPGYDAIRVKGANLELLANRYQVIAREDTLQNLAKLTEVDRGLRIGEIVRSQIKKTVTTPDAFIAAIDVPDKSAVTEGKFYFNNTTALSQGLYDFKKRWGNRKLEDNWRISSKSSAQTVAMNNNTDAATSGLTATAAADMDETALLKSYQENLPLTAIQLEQSNQRIIDSYYDIANFYKDELKDNAEAEKIYQELLKRYPENKYKPAIYYSLYRINEVNASTKSAEYRELLLKQFPESSYAKIIIDPAFSQKVDNKGIALNNAYNEVYNLYIQKKYSDVLSFIGQLESHYTENPLSSQLAYLNALAVGHTQILSVFEDSLKSIVETYPEDKLVTPLIKQHLEFTKANHDEMERRPTALVENDINEPRFVEEPKNEPVQQIAVIPQNIPAVKPQVPESVVPKVDIQATSVTPVTSLNPSNLGTGNVVAKDINMFSMPDSAEYYYVVNVLDPRVNLSSSRFGIGQFNRSNQLANQIKHQLKTVTNENQLIFVGSFSNRNAAKSYEGKITPLMRDIMKIDVEKYNTFVITKADLDKLLDRNMINNYIQFYKQQN